MRIRVPIACAFGALLLLSAYLGFGKVKVPSSGTIPSDKVLHFVTFFLLTLCFYWILDTSRRRVMNMTLIVMFLFGSIGSEFVQGALPYRTFDPYDIVMNLAGSSCALGLCMWYHRRMLERRRHAKNVSYSAVPGEEAELGIIEEEENEDESADITSAASGSTEAVGGGGGGGGGTGGEGNSK